MASESHTLTGIENKNQLPFHPISNAKEDKYFNLDSCSRNRCIASKQAKIISEVSTLTEMKKIKRLLTSFFFLGKHPALLSFSNEKVNYNLKDLRILGFKIRTFRHKRVFCFVLFF